MTDLFPISKCTIPELCFDFGGEKKKKKKYDLNENTSGKVNILTGAGEECGRLFQKLKATWLWNFLELSYQHTVTSKFNN